MSEVWGCGGGRQATACCVLYVCVGACVRGCVRVCLRVRVRLRVCVRAWLWGEGEPQMHMAMEMAMAMAMAICDFRLSTVSSRPGPQALANYFDYLTIHSPSGRPS